MTEDINLKLRVCVHCPKINQYYQGDNSIFFYRIMPLFRLRLFILYQVPRSQALTSAYGALVYSCTVIWLLTKKAITELAC